MKKLFARWAVLQLVSYLCVAFAILLFVSGLTRIGSGSTTTPYIPHMLLLAVLFYSLHWRFQGLAYRADFVRSDQFVAMIKARPSRTDPDW